jgi:hypothetical protein
MFNGNKIVHVLVQLDGGNVASSLELKHKGRCHLFGYDLDINALGVFLLDFLPGKDILDIAHIHEGRVLAGSYFFLLVRVELNIEISRKDSHSKNILLVCA